MTPWWQHAVVYQVYPRSFADSDGDGEGDLRGVLSRLDHLVDLGVDVLWLSPVYRSPMRDNGYDISDYQAVDPRFGSLADLDELIEALHSRGMKLLMDLVVNHSSSEHPWFQESRDPSSEKRDWYWWRPARPGFEPGAPGAEPNDWRAFFSGPAWTYDEQSGEYYLHVFSPHQPDLNWENPAVRAAVHEMMRWWLDRGVDGFRMDVINMISKDPELPGRYFGFPGPRVHEFLQEMHREVFAGRDGLLTVGEMPGVTVEDARLFTDPDRHELDMVFQFEHVMLDHGRGKWDARPLHLPDLKRSLGRWQDELAERGWNSLYLNNHDQPRAVSRLGDDGRWRERSATMLATLLHLHRGTPYVYQGEELGMTNYPFTSIGELRDLESVNHYTEAVDGGRPPEQVLTSLRAMSRDNARTPMQWDDSEHAGFTSGTPWLAVHPDSRDVNAAAQRDDPGSVLSYYRRLIELRHTSPVVSHGDFTMLLPDDERVYSFSRRLDDVELLVLCNVSADVVEVDLPDVETWTSSPVLIGNLPGATGSVLQPWEARVHHRSTGE